MIRVESNKALSLSLAILRFFHYILASVGSHLLWRNRMFEQEIENIIQNTQAKTIGNASSIRVTDILNAPILPSIKTFFQAEVESWLMEERAHQSLSGRFRYDEPEVSKYQKQIDSILIRNAVLSREEFLSILDKAVKLEFNYICRPQWTLPKFVFKNDKVKSCEEIQSGLRYFYDYPYYQEIFSRFVEKKGIKEMSLETFEQIIKRIDEGVLQSYSPAELAHLTQPIFDVILEAQPHKGNVIPIEALIIFFDDKNRIDVVEKLEFEQEVHHQLMVSMSRLVSLIESVNVPDRAREETRYTEATQEVQHTEETIKEPLVPQEHEKVNTISQMSEEKQLTFEQPGTIEIKERVSHPSVSPTPQQEPISYYIRKRLGKRTKKKIIRRIFRGDTAQYEIVLATLNNIKTWGEASIYIDSVFIKNGVDPYSSTAIKFTDIVQEVFLSRERPVM